ncbi:MAG TPA: acyl carrier protein [Gemmataceae bacterium]|nr:acyl carrier protein [Gemmataceae bacterium]
MCENLLPPDPLAVVMAVEEKFGVTIPDEEAEKICTMGQLYDFVLAHVVRGRAQVCVTSAAFYRLRRALGEVCGVPRERVRPRARLEDLVPFFDRPRYWQELQARLSDLRLPPLRRPAWLVRWIDALSLVPLFLAVLVTVVLIGVLGQTPAALLVLILALPGCPVVGFVGMFLVCQAACRRTERYAVHIPPACATIRVMVYSLVSGRPAAPMVSDAARASDKEIWGALCAIVGCEFDRPPDSFTRDTQFV